MDLDKLLWTIKEVNKIYYFEEAGEDDKENND